MNLATKTRSSEVAFNLRPHSGVRTHIRCKCLHILFSYIAELLFSFLQLIVWIKCNFR